MIQGLDRGSLMGELSSVEGVNEMISMSLKEMMPKMRMDGKEPLLIFSFE